MKSLPDYLQAFASRRIAAITLLGFSSGLPLALTSGTLQAWMTVSGVDIRTIGDYMRKHKSSVSEATSYKEISEFWDTHDLSEFWDKTKEVSFEVDIESEVTYYAVDKILSEKIQAIAQKRGVTADTLINLWVQEKLQEQQRIS